MAEILTYEFFPTEDIESPYNEEVNVSVYWDTVAEDFVVKVNGNVQTDGPVFRQGTVNNVISRPYFYSFCDGNDLNEAVKNGTSVISFPYVKMQVTENSPVCNGNTCDLIINSVDVVTDTGSGGELTINATSSAPIFSGGTTNIIYSIGGPFLGTPTFSGIAGGTTYNITALDSKGCRYETKATVPLNIGYGTRYVAEFDNINGTNRIEIQQLNYQGASEEICLAERGYNLSYSNYTLDTIYTDVIKPSNLTLRVLSDTKDKFQGTFTSSHKRWRAIVTDVDSGDEIWRGYIFPSEYSEPYEDAPYVTELRFADGLAMLERIQSDTLPINGSNAMIKTIASILNETSLGLPIHVSIEMFANGMDSNGETLAQTFLNYESILNRELNLYETLEEILKPFTCVFLQQDGAWWIIRKEQLFEPFDYFIYNEVGNQTGTGTYDGVKTWDCADSEEYVGIRGQSLEIMPAYGKINLVNEFDLKQSLLNNFNFEKPGFATEFVSWTFVKNGSTCNFGSTQTPEGTSAEFSWSIFTAENINDAYIVSTPANIRWQSGDKIRFRYKIAYDRVNSVFPFLIVKSRVKLGNDYLQPDGTWDSGTADLRFYPSPQGGFTEISIEENLPDNPSITADTIQVFIWASRAEEAEIITAATYADLEAVSTTDKEIGYKTTIAFTGGTIVDEYYELVEGVADVVPDDYDVNTNDKQWQRIPVPFQTFDLLDAIQKQTTFIVDNVEIDYLPQGFPPIEDQESTYVLDQFNPEELDLTLKFGTLPWDFVLNTDYSPNDKYQYSSPFLGGIAKPFPTEWGRKGVDESARLQFIYINQIVTQHQTPTKVISGKITNRNFRGGSNNPRLKPLDCLLNTYDNKYYIVVAYSALDFEGSYDVTLVELKAAEGIEGGAFSDGFSDGFS